MELTSANLMLRVNLQAEVAVVDTLPQSLRHPSHRTQSMAHLSEQEEVAVVVDPPVLALVQDSQGVQEVLPQC